MKEDIDFFHKWSKPSVDELMDKIDEGDEKPCPIGELWGLLDQDGAAREHWRALRRSFASKKYQRSYWKAGSACIRPSETAFLKSRSRFLLKEKLDPENDGVNTREEFTQRVMMLLNVDE